MNFFNPLGAIGLISLPLIVLLYTVKQKSRKKQVSSLYLWEKINADKSGTSFFQKLKNNIFLYMDLLAALLITLALTEAYIHRTASGESLVIAIDNSLSMQTEDVKPNRLDAAKKEAVRLIDNAAPNQIISIVTLNDEPQITANRQTDKLVLKNAVEAVKPTFGGCDGERAAALIDSLGGAGAKVVVLSDNKQGLSGNYERIDLSTDKENCAITNVSHKINENGGVSVFAVAENHGTKPVEKTINIYADNKIIDTVLVTIQPNSKTQMLADTDFVPSEIVAELSPKDALPADDTRYLTVAADSIKKVLLISPEGNMFLEKAFNAQPDVELYKGTSYSGATGYDYYVFDGTEVSEYPKDGGLLFFNSNEQKLFKSTDSEKISDQITGSDINISVLRSHGIKSSFLEPMMYDGDRVIMARGENNGQNIFVCGFDLHDSDLPLKSDFPILIYNILNDFENRMTPHDFVAGTLCRPTLRADTVKAEITDPNGVKKELKNGSFTPDICGIYTLYENDRQTAKIAVNCVPSAQINGVVHKNGDRIKINYKLRKIFLLLAILLLAAEFVLYILRVKTDKRIIIIRALIFALIIGSITDFSFSSETKDSDTIFILDSSESTNSDSKKMLEFINTAMQSKTKKDFTALIAFGANTAVDSGLSNSKTSYSPTVLINKNQTNIENAVNTADGLFSNERGKHIVLLTDGKETAGNVSAIKNSDAYIDIVEFSSEPSNEAQLSAIRIPSKINKNSEYDITLQIDSLSKQQCNVKLYRNDKLIYDNTVNLENGENRYVVRDFADEASSVVYKCEIFPQEDTYKENNTLYKHTYIRDIPSVLVLEHGGSGQNVYELMQSFGVNVKRSDIGVYSQDSEKISENDLVIMADCPVTSMSDDFLENIKNYVQNSAGGLIVTGGKNSFALGGYKDNIMEDILPVDMDMINNEVNGDVAFYMVSDRSGSMGGGSYGKDKLETVKSAMAGAVRNLTPSDTVAVIAFDDSGEWIVPPMKVGKNTETIVTKISGITLGGGTSILPSLKMAYEKIREEKAAYKHIILMTDGHAETGGYDELIRSMKADDITLSTIAVGSDADTKLLEKLAEMGGGRYYFTDEFSNLPNIFSREAKLAGRDYINNTTFFPSVAADDDVLKNVEQIPSLDGYIATKSKSTGKTVLATELGEPILSHWQYGLGKTAAFTSDMENFCGNWLSSTEGRTILKNLVSATMRRPVSLNGEISYTERGEKGVITIDFNDPPQNVGSGSINNKKLNFVQTSIGRYEAETELLDNGSYIINAVIKDKDGNENVLNDGVEIGYSKEFDIKNQSNSIKRLEADNIRFITDPYSVFAQRKYKVNHSLVLYKWLLPAALILFLAEIFLRRIGTPKLPQKKEKTPKVKETAAVQEESTAQMLLSSKRNRGTK